MAVGGGDVEKIGDAERPTKHGGEVRGMFEGGTVASAYRVLHPVEDVGTG